MTTTDATAHTPALAAALADVRDAEQELRAAQLVCTPANDDTPRLDAAALVHERATAHAWSVFAAGL